MSAPFKVAHAAPDWSEDGYPVSTQFGDTYYSREGGLAESAYLFIEQNGIAELLKEKALLSIGELGFGTGLNFLLTWDAWKKSGTHAPLDYVACEKHPLSRSDLERALAPWHQLAPLANQLTEAIPPLVPGFLRILFENGLVALTLLIGEASDQLAELETPMDVWYLDGFAPAKNPGMWSNEIFSHIKRLSKSGTRCSSFTAAGEVRAHLANSGFTVEKIPGFGRKRDSIRAVYCAEPEDPVLLPPWKRIPPIEPRRSGTVAIIGGGLAGHGAAYALCARGFSVTIFEASAEGFAGASGNPAGIFSPYIAREQNWATDLYLASFLFSRARIITLEKELGKPLLHRSGSIQFAHTARLTALVQSFGSLGIDPEIAFASESPIPQITFPLAGWLEPRRLCDAIAERYHSQLRVRLNSPIERLDAVQEGWCLRSISGERFDCDIVIVAAAHEASRFLQTSWVPLEPIRGEVIWVTAQSPLNSPVRIGRGYALPAFDGQRVIGASYAHGRKDLDSIAGERKALLDQALPLDAELAHAEIAGSRVSFRSSTHHRLPYVGPVVQRAAYDEIFRDLKKGFPSSHFSMPPYHQNLYISAGHGSRGLLSTIAAGELLANYICGATPLFSSSLRGELNPASYLAKMLLK